MSRSVPLVLLVLGSILAGGCREGRDYAETVAGGLDRASRTEVRASLQTLATALERYQIDRGRYPERLEELPEVATGRSKAEDPWGHAFLYRPSETGYEVRSPGPDGRPGTEDDIVLRDGRVE